MSIDLAADLDRVTPASPAGVAYAALETAWAALARVPRSAPAATIRNACDRVARAELAVSRATTCQRCGAGVREDCEAYCPEAPDTAAEIRDIFLAQMG